MPTLPASNSRELLILEHIENDPDVTQAGLAEELGVAVGTINFALRRLIKKGYVHAKQLQRRRLKYIITPSGIAFRSKLAMDSLQYSMRLYRETRAQAKQLIAEARRLGHGAVALRGEGDLAEIVSLTCLEMKMNIQPPQKGVPSIGVEGLTLKLEIDAENHADSV